MSLFSDRNRLQKTARAFAGTVLLTSLVLTGLIVALRQFGLLQEMELDAYDSFIRSRSDQGPDERLLVVGVSEEDIQRRKEYPLRDGTLAEVLEKLLSNQPRSIGIDIARDVPQGPAAGRAKLMQVLKGSDRLFAACLLSSATQPGIPAAPGIPPEQIGFADLPQDPSGVVRRSILVSTPTPPPVVIGQPHLCNYADLDNQVLSLSFLLATDYLEPKGIVPEQTETGELQLGSVVLPALTEQAGGYHSTGAPDYQIMLNYRSADNAVRQVTLTQVLEGQVEPSWIKDKIVLIGYTSQVANDIRYTPYLASQDGNRGMPGVVIHAQATSQLLSAVLDQRPLLWYLPEAGEILWIWGWSLVGGILAFYVRRTWKFVVAGGVALLLCYGIPYLLFLQGGWLPLVPSMLGLVVTAAGVSFVDRATKGGYTQAIYEQLKEQLQGGIFNAQGHNQQTDYLEDLVQRARAVRQRREPGALVDFPLVAEPAQPALPTGAGTQETEALYQKIREQVESDLQQDHKADTLTKAQRIAQAKQKRLQTLLHRSRNARSHQHVPLGGDGKTIAPEVEADQPETKVVE